MKYTLKALMLALVFCLAGGGQGRTQSTYVPAPPEIYVPIVSMGHQVLRGAGDTYNRADIRKVAGVQCWYNWGPTPGADGIPMLWNASHIGTQLSGDSVWLMGFNEPDVPGQANMTPEQAVAAWRQVEQIYPDRRLISPGVMNLTWLSIWHSKYLLLYGQPPRVDAVAVHWYYTGNGTPLDSFRLQVGRAIDLARGWGVAEVWVTEFALYPCWGLDSVQFARDAYAWLDTQPMVTRAFWFQTYMTGSESWAPGPECNSSLGNADGTLTPIGLAFRGVNGQAMSPNWDERADVTKDGVVDIFDLTIVASHFGDRKY